MEIITDLKRAEQLIFPSFYLYSLAVFHVITTLVLLAIPITIAIVSKVGETISFIEIIASYNAIIRACTESYEWSDSGCNTLYVTPFAASIIFLCSFILLLFLESPLAKRMVYIAIFLNVLLAILFLVFVGGNLSICGVVPLLLHLGYIRSLRICDNKTVKYT